MIKGSGQYILIISLLCCFLVRLQAQESLVSSLHITETAPNDLLATRSAVLYDYKLKISELEEIQSAFQKIGIDAVTYFDAGKVTAGLDPARAYSDYMLSREIKFLILLQRTADGYSFIATPFNGAPSFVNPQQEGWRVIEKQLREMLLRVYRDSWLTQKKQNFLINDLPELEIVIPVIAGRRSLLFPIDLKIDNLAVPKAADPNTQGQVERLMTEIYPFPNKYKFIDAVPPLEKDLRKQGFQYIIHFVNCRGKTARELLGYDVTRGESAYGTMTYPNGTPQVKTISVDAPIYKFYIKHIESGNVFIGNNWDADETFIQSLKNHIMGFRAELKLN